MLSSNTSAANGAANYIEDVFSTYLYTGTGASQTHTNNIDLAGKGGLVWLKKRSAVESHYLQDSSSSFANSLSTNSTAAQITGSGVITAVSSTGFTTSSVSSGTTYASWTFRKQPKFFDVVTWTGNGASYRTITHNLGSTPGCVMVKRTDSTGDWVCFFPSATAWLTLNTTNAAGPDNTLGGYPGALTATDFLLNPGGSSNVTNVNASGGTYVAYLFAHNAGGFGLTGTDNVISCGSYTGNDSNDGPEINLGWEPQWVMIKNVTTAGNAWRMFDNMRGMDVNTTGSGDGILSANTSSAEAYSNRLSPTATGFKITDTAGDVNSPSGNTFIYIAIRRGPMKVPTTGTSVYNAIPRSGTNAAGIELTGVGFPVDLCISSNRTSSSGKTFWDRLRGGGRNITSTGTGAEQSVTEGVTLFSRQNGVYVQGITNYNAAGENYIEWFLRRAPGFFDEVCYTGGGSSTSIYNHNLGVPPELIIIKSRSNGTNVNYWPVKAKAIIGQRALALNSASSDPISATYWPTTNDTATQFRVRASSTAYDSNATGYTYVAYLFASCPGVSKFGSYTGTGTTLQVDCGFTGGARFVMIKRADTSGSGDWYVWDSARGIVAGNDPYLLLNSTAAEVTNTDYVDTYSAGFEISSTAPAAINASGGTFIFLAIA